jgi:hypothetical protein
VREFSGAVLQTVQGRFFYARIVLQQHETKRVSPSRPMIGTVVAKQTPALDNQFVTRRAGSRQ